MKIDLARIFSRGKLLPTSVACLLAASVNVVYAQQSMQAPTNGQLSTAPGASSTPTSSASASASTAITTPTNTVGNTASSVRTGGNQNSGYSAGGNTVNSNINNTSTGGRSNGQPIGTGSKTTKPYGSR